jgi:hypothetical protein
MLDEAGERHSERLRELTDRTLAAPQRRQHRTSRRIGERTEDAVEAIARIVNHPV